MSQPQHVCDRFLEEHFQLLCIFEERINSSVLCAWYPKQHPIPSVPHSAADTVL